MIVPIQHSEKKIIQEPNHEYLEVVIHPAKTNHLVDEEGKH